ncbi:olfactory receptor 11A1-like [Hyperolius riggenbachi]|uniref:olfactory receptor 11A1-like n=1 Tax=Hyperolius riggenbachi TaxID=752182 RepID=UPI0035A39FA1
MCEVNQTEITEIRLVGFQDLNTFIFPFFIVLLLIYIFILFGNLLIVILVTTFDHLKIPMFFFLKHLATVDVLLTTTIVPVMLHTIFTEEKSISFVNCMSQLYCFGTCTCVQCYVIATMSYDRYVAICIPLRYAFLMNPNVCVSLVVGSWCLGTVIMSSEMIAVFHLDFCGLNYIDHFFCDFGPVVELSTSDTTGIMIHDFVISILLLPLPFACIVLTYICISFNILKISSATGRRKAFSTCSSHLATVCTYYGTLMTVYMVQTDYSTVNINKYRSLLYILGTPLINPFIYSLRNHEIKKTLLKLSRDGIPSSYKAVATRIGNANEELIIQL